MKFILLIFIFLSSFSLNAAQVERPSKKYPDQALNNYGWLLDYKLATLSSYVNDTGKNFISEESLERYVKLKLRNFISTLKIKDKDKEKKDAPDFKHNFLSVELELEKYNDKQKIYYGLISFRMEVNIYNNSKTHIYKLTKAIAGSEGQMLNFIKEDIDAMVELFAEDYYFVSDELEKHNKSLKQDK